MLQKNNTTLLQTLTVFIRNVSKSVFYKVPYLSESVVDGVDRFFVVEGVYADDYIELGRTLIYHADIYMIFG